MLSVAEAHARLMTLFAPLEHETVPLALAGGRVLARDVVAGRDQPPFAASAMDGYAVREADARPGAVLQVIGTAQAGARFGGPVGPGEAVRIFTGAPLPDGAGRVVIQEDVLREAGVITLGGTLDQGGHVRPAGGDFRAGDRVTAPRRIRPADLALIAAMNAPTVKVARRPVVAVIPTGDELVPPGGIPGPDQILTSNNFGLKAMLEAAGAEVRLLPIARDTRESLRAVLDLAAGADLIVTLGGVSVGDFDLVQETARGEGMALAFYKVAIRPGKPLMAGRIGTQPIIGLPGNPVSAMVCGQVFIVPAVQMMLGLGSGLPEQVAGRLSVDVEENGPRMHYMRARVERGPEGWLCAPFDRQDSSLLSVLAAADGLVVRPPFDPARGIGDKVEFIWCS